MYLKRWPNRAILLHITRKHNVEYISTARYFKTYCTFWVVADFLGNVMNMTQCLWTPVVTSIYRLHNISIILWLPVHVFVAVWDDWCWAIPVHNHIGSPVHSVWCDIAAINMPLVQWLNTWSSSLTILTPAYTCKPHCRVDWKFSHHGLWWVGRYQSTG